MQIAAKTTKTNAREGGESPTFTRGRALTPAQMYARLLASDADYNGRFFVGVTSTGIYCLPSCKARKPLRKNVRFFRTCEEARALGLRPCRKCYPDDFERGADPVLESIEALAEEIRAEPADFADARAIVKRSGFGATRLFELFRLHYHTTPADFLLRARIDAAKRKLLATRGNLSAIAYEAGFEGLSAFHDNFRRLNGLTPAAWRGLKTGNTFTIQLPKGYPLGYLCRALSRDKHSVTERFKDDVYVAGVLLENKPSVMELRLSPDRVVATIKSARKGALPGVHAMVVGILGLDQDAEAFAKLARRLKVPQLVTGRPGLHISQTHSVFDGLLWAIVGQQINFPFACLLKSRLMERAGTPVGEGLYAPPTPEAVAALDPADLLPLQFSRQKAEYVVAVARMVAKGKLDLDALRTMSATRVERTLLGVRGLGPWSVNYLMMRSLGFADCVPLGDTGVSSGLQTLFNIKRPDIDAVRKLMAQFSPYRSLATAHLWQLNQPIPS